MRTHQEPRQPRSSLSARFIANFLAVSFSLFAASPASAQAVLDPAQVFQQGVACPADQPGAPNNFTCTSNDITLTLVQLSNLTACNEGEMTSATFDVDLSVNANIRYNPMIWIASNGIDPRVSGSICFVSSVPDGPLTHIPQLAFTDANVCADVDVPNNGFVLSDLSLGTVQFLCEDTDSDGKAEIPIIVTWNNSSGAACAQGGPYPINETPSKCDAFTAETDITVVPNPGLNLSKSGTWNDTNPANGVANVGETISYTLTVENTGNVPLPNVSVTDPLITGAPNNGTITCPGGNPIPNLAVGATVVCTASYSITQADIDFGAVLNTATATSGQQSDTADANVPLPPGPNVQVVKSGSPNFAGAPQAGDTITYTFNVTNTGNLTLHNLQVTDTIVASISCTGGNPIASLAPGATAPCTGDYTLTQADINSGSVSNTVTVTSDEGATDTDDDTQPLLQLIELTLVKTATPQTYNAVSQNIAYTYVLTNSGNVTLHGPYSVSDDKATATCDPTPDPLLPGQSVNCSANYTITQADLNAGSVTNTATGTALDPADQTVTSDPDSETVTAVVTGTLQLVKTATPSTYDTVGDIISYSYALTNSTNLSLHGPYTITDDKTTATCDATPDPLLPGQTVNCSATYAITQADLDAGSVTNTATGTALDPNEQTVTSNPDSETVDAVFSGSLTLVKTASPQTYTAADDVISYSFQLTNNTNMTLHAPYTIDDDKATDESCAGQPASMAPGESVTCTASYTITAADVTAGSVTNTATGTALRPDDQVVTSNPDSETVNLVVEGTLSLVKTATPQTYSVVGEVISYSYQLTNNTNITLYEPYTIDDDKSVDESCAGQPASMAPGASVTCTASYTITQADLDAGSVTNVASGTAQDAASAGQTVTSNTDTETVTAVVTGSLGLEKTASPTTYSAAGDNISYSYVLTNNTNITLYAPYTITDDKTTATCPGTPASLAPNGVGTVTCTATYVIAAGDVTAGSVTNTASGTAQDAPTGGQPVQSNTDTATVNLASVNLAKSAAAPTYSAVTGRYTVVYTITASNAGSAASSYNLVDTFTPGAGITLYSAVLAYGGGETQTGTPAGPLPYSFSSGETIVTGEGLGAGASELWTVTAQFTVDPSQVDASSRGCVVGQEQAGQGFYNLVSGIDAEIDTTDNDACTNLPDPSVDLSKSAGEPSFNGNGSFTVVYTVTANNLGQGPGYYDLTDVIDPGNGITVTSAQLSSYNAGTENAQTGTLAGALPYTFSSGATLVSGEALAALRDESWTITVEFNVAFDSTDDTLQCSEVNGGAGTGFYNRAEGSASDPDLSNNDACVNPSGGEVVFRVTKDFLDDNTDLVNVHISCNTGLPLDQDKEIGDVSFDEGVGFVVTSFEPGALNCEIYETPVPAGYEPIYEAGEGDLANAEQIGATADACVFNGVTGGEFTCVVTNDPQPVAVTVNKYWEIFNPGNGNEFPLEAEVTLYCDAPIVDGSENQQTGYWFKEFDVLGDTTHTEYVVPAYPSSRCWAVESNQTSYVEVLNDCGDSFGTAQMSVSVGHPAECTITNTVFFEGIPTLNRYGLALLVLLMLGVGFVGFRRFV